MFDIKGIMPSMGREQTDAVTKTISDEVSKRIAKDLNAKYHEDFDKIALEFQKVTTYINQLELRVIQLEQKQRQDKEG
jgi:hypothetical protein